MEDSVEKELERELNKIARGLVDYVSEEALSLLQKHIMADTYEYGGKNKYYLPSRGQNPSYEFLNSFNLSGSKKILEGYVQELLYNWESMHVWSETYETESMRGGASKTRTTVAHGKIDERTGNLIDLREKLFDILNVDKGVNKERRPFWDNFVKELPNMVPIWAKKYLNKTGLGYTLNLGFDLDKVQDEGDPLPF